MPIYDYNCSKCGHITEVIHGINDVGPRFCPNCGADGTMKKGFSTPAVHFKGSGWARKDRSVSGSSRSSTTKDSKDGATKDGAGTEAGSRDAGVTDGGSKSSSDTSTSAAS